MPLSPERIKLRHRILPRTVIGISFMLLSFGVGAAFSGAAFYAYYDNRLAENEATVSRFVDTFDKQFADATGALDELRVDAIADIRAELQPMEGYVDDATAITGFPISHGESVWALETYGDRGEARVGSAFAVAAHRDGTAFLTTYSLVAASTVEPSPGIELVKGDRRLPANLWSWDTERDLAILIVDEAVPTLELADASQQTQSVGRAVFALSGVGGQGATVSPGRLLDHSRVGLQHTAAVGPLFDGGPLVDVRGQVIGVTATAYRPYGVDQGDVASAPDIAGLCAQILECGDRLVSVPTDSPSPEVLADAGTTEDPATDAATESTDE